MSKKFEIALLNTKGGMRALEKLIDVVSNAIGRLYTPVDKVINAHADAKSMQVLAQAKRMELELDSRTALRLAHVEEKRQANIDAIVLCAAEALPHHISDAEVDSDWVTAFFEHCKDVGNEEMRQIWGRILAGEVAQPGTFSRRTLSIVQSMDKSDANSFTKLCSIAFKYQPKKFALFIPSTEVFEHIRMHSCSPADEVHLKNIGLLSSDKLHLVYEKTYITIEYFDEHYSMAPNVPRRKDQQRFEDSAEYFPFTQAGNELFFIAGSSPDKKFLSLWKETDSVPGNFHLVPRVTP